MPEFTTREIPPDWPVDSHQSPLSVPVSRLVLALLSRYHIEGRENIPEAPFLIVGNHLSYFDIPALLPAFPRGIVGFAARKYQGTWKEPFFRMNALIWLTQFSADREALRAAAFVLEHGGILGVAPEGTRSKTGGLIQGREGAAFLATRTNVPILPTAIWGTEKILRHPRPRVTVRFGKPFRLPEGRAKAGDLDEYTERIMCAIAALLPEQYHGIYAGNPLIAEMAKIVR
jgi:1-acyl-sn-glycerol-3-phosphate acyltransferase